MIPDMIQVGDGRFGTMPEEEIQRLVRLIRMLMYRLGNTQELSDEDNRLLDAPFNALTESPSQVVLQSEMEQHARLVLGICERWMNEPVGTHGNFEKTQKIIKCFWELKNEVEKL